MPPIPGEPVQDVTRRVELPSSDAPEPWELPSLDDVTRPRAELPSFDASEPWAELPSVDDVTRPRAELPLPDAPRPRAEMPPPMPRPRAEPPPPPPRTQSADTQPRVLLGTYLGDTGASSDPASRTDPSGLRPPALQPPAQQPPAQQPPALQPPVLQPPVLQPPVLQPPVLHPAETPRKRHAGSSETMELPPPDIAPRQSAGRSGWLLVVPIVLVTLASVTYFLYDMQRSGAFLADPGEVAPKPPASIPIKPPGPPGSRETQAGPAADPTLATARDADGGASTSGGASAPDAKVDVSAPDLELEPLTPPLRKIAKRRAPKSTAVTREWSKARAAFEELERAHPCDETAMLGLCTQYDSLRLDVENGTDPNQEHMLSRIRGFEKSVADKRGGD
jgi:hypothetical protein